MKESLKKIIKDTIAISDENTEMMLSLFHPVNLEKEEYFLKEGKRCQHIAFVV